MGWVGGWVGASTGGGGGDTTPPVVTIVSPDPNVTPGDSGGFPRSPAAAKVTPIVLQVTDVDPGTAYIAIIAKFANSDDDREEVVFRRGTFKSPYISNSYYASIANGYQFTILRDGGWPAGTGVAGDIVFYVDTVDGDGNLNDE